MKCNHNSVTTPFCPSCGAKVHVYTAKNEIIEYMRERLNNATHAMEWAKKCAGADATNDPVTKSWGEQEFPRKKASVDRWNRWIEWLLKQENNP